MNLQGVLNLVKRPAPTYILFFLQLHAVRPLALPSVHGVDSEYCSQSNYSICNRTLKVDLYQQKTD